MKRLTEIDEYGNADIIGMEDETWQMGLSFNDMNKVTLALNRLHRLEKLYEQHKQPDPDTGLVPCGCGEWIYTIEKGSCMDYHVTAKCSECGWDWFSKDGVGNFSAVFSAFITNGDSKRDEAERFLIENAKANNKLNYCPNCGRALNEPDRRAKE